MIDRILYLIGKNNITASKLCKDLSISVSSITDWKKGKGTPSVDTLIKISRYFNVTLDWLIAGQVNNVQFSVEESEMLTNFRQLSLLGKAEFKGFLQGILRNKECVDTAESRKSNS